MDISQGDRIGSDSLLFLDASENVHTFNLVNGMIDPANQIRIYYANGDPVNVLGWGSPDAYLLTSGYGGRYLEDEATGNVYGINSPLSSQLVTFDATGVYHAAEQSIDAAFTITSTVQPTIGKAFLGNVAYQDGSKVAALTVSSGAVTGATERTFSVAIFGVMRFSNASFYAQTASGISKLDMMSGTEEAIISASGITDFEVLADQVFYSTPSGIYQYDTVSATTMPYAGGEPEPVSG